MIEPCFNELSIEPLCADDLEVEQRIGVFVSTLNALKDIGIKRVRYENGFSDIALKKNYTLFEYCNEAKSGKQKNNKDFLYGFLRKPYLNDEKEEEKNLFCQYEDCKYIDEERSQVDCLGLYVAFLLNSFAVGFDHTTKNKNNSEKEETHTKCQLLLTKDGMNIEGHVWCITKPEHLYEEELVELLSDQNDLPVEKTRLSKENKKKHLPPHHGIDKCRDHADDLLSSPYIIEVLNSIYFDSKEKQYIHLVRDPNVIEVRLYWTKEGFGLCVATTAKNVIQNKWIAKHLQNKYEKH